MWDFERLILGIREFLNVISEFSIEGSFSSLSFPRILVTNLDMLSDREDSSNIIEARRLAC